MPYALMGEIERRLRERGGPKLNLQVRSSNVDVLAFYHKLGYVQDEVVSFGRRLVEDSHGVVADCQDLENKDK